jgi:hypothetical protein
MRRLILGVAFLAIIVGTAALGFAARGHATSKQRDIDLHRGDNGIHVNPNGTRNIELHWGDHVSGNTINVSCGYSLGAHQQHSHLYCFGPGRKGPTRS